MKKSLSVLLVFGVAILFVSGCSSSAVQTKLQEATQRVMQKDQNYEQWFELTRAFVYDAFYETGNYLNLSSEGLTSIPDLCSLLKVEDYSKVRILNLSNNRIRVVNQDLSCLQHLRVLNLSYNQIVEVVSLWYLPSLQELLLHKNQLTSTKLPDFPALKTLNLWYNKLKKVSGLEKFGTLTRLELQHNEIAKIIGIENLQKLESLKVEYNKLKKLPVLETLKNLREVTVEWNELAENIKNELKKINDLYKKIQGQTGSAASWMSW